MKYKCKYCNTELSETLNTKLNKYIKDREYYQIKNHYPKGQKVYRKHLKRHLYINTIKYPETQFKPFVFCSFECKLRWMNQND